MREGSEVGTKEGPVAEHDDLGGGRRDYDPQSPLIELMEARILRVFENQLKETRHMLRDELASLAAQVATNTLKSTEEHGQVQLKLAEMRADLNELRPLKQTVAELKTHDSAEHARDEATHDLTRSLWRAAAVISGLIVSATGVLVAVLT
jgi:DNA-binding transcriptional MerR regulator